MSTIQINKFELERDQKNILDAQYELEAVTKQVDPEKIVPAREEEKTQTRTKLFELFRDAKEISSSLMSDCGTISKRIGDVINAYSHADNTLARSVKG